MKRQRVVVITTTAKRQARASLKRVRALYVRRPSPLARLTPQEAIERIREVREELWEAKVAPRS